MPSNSLETLETAYGGQGLPDLTVEQRILFLMFCTQRITQNEEPSTIPPPSALTIMYQFNTPDALLLMERLITSIRASFQAGEGQTY